MTGFWFQGLGSSLSGNDCVYMVVFQYGSIVLFNVLDHDVDGFLKIVEKHASGLLPEMRKDGEALCHQLMQLCHYVILVKFFFIWLNVASSTISDVEHDSKRKSQ
ncbi:hypothetical protein Dimus_003550 [Dionaea muscipula]